MEDETDDNELRMADLEGQIGAINKSQAVIEFALDGTILNANRNFCDALGYSLEEIKGRHHRMFVEPSYAQSTDYRMFWDKLARGEYDAGQYLRLGKNGREVWIQASYNPIPDRAGRPIKVVKYATDVTAQKRLLSDLEGQVSAISKSQAVIEFELDGTIVSANDNFCAALGYTLDEIRGQHHRMFVEQGYAQSEEYREFWRKLGRGQFDAGQYLRLGKNGREVWIQASYNPILDASGRPFKVIKYATDITQVKLHQADLDGQIAAIGKVQAVIEFDLDGTIRTANENFCKTVGYSLEEIKGRHHRMFVEPVYAESHEYREFWQKLGRGQFDAGQYLRLGKGGAEVWIQASYNPILDPAGRPFKVVKYATNISAQKAAAVELERVLSESSRVMAALSDGDLTQRMEGVYSAEFTRLQEATNSSMTKLHETVVQIRSAAVSITSAAGEISQGNTDLSQRTEEQASSLEETAASIEQLTVTVKQNADNAREASQLASSTRDRANHGGEVVQNAVNAMSAINESSKKISDIIGVIDEIAFQTNLLALNAAVEAARAGEQGRGFAVVASEVRNLAQRSAGAAKEIKSLINDSVHKVEEGSRLVNASGETLTQIVDSVKSVAGIISEIAAASQEQSSGIDQVNKAVGQMDQVTQQNAALVEEAAAAAESLDEQARGLMDSMAFFVTDEDREARPDSRTRHGRVGSGAAPQRSFAPRREGRVR